MTVRVGDDPENLDSARRSLTTRSAGSCISPGRATVAMCCSSRTGRAMKTSISFAPIHFTPMPSRSISHRWRVLGPKSLDLPRSRPQEAIVAINGRDKRYFDAYRLDLETGELQLIEKNPGDIDRWHVDHTGTSAPARPRWGPKRKSAPRTPPRDRSARWLPTLTKRARACMDSAPMGLSLFFQRARCERREVSEARPEDRQGNANRRRPRLRLTQCS